MTSRMRDFLERAARAELGRGILVKRPDSRIASQAITAGYGWMITAPLKVFIIYDAGREALLA